MAGMLFNEQNLPLDRLFYEALGKAYVGPEESSKAFEKNDFRWSETKLPEDSPTGKPQILINFDKFKNDPRTKPGFEKDMIIGEGLHLLKLIAPQRFDKLYQSAIADPEVRQWLNESYQYSKERGEKRDFEKWVKHSRLDQIIGGYLLGGPDSKIPTMQNWDKDKLPYGKVFKEEIEKLKQDLKL